MRRIAAALILAGLLAGCSAEHYSAEAPAGAAGGYAAHDRAQPQEMAAEEAEAAPEPAPNQPGGQSAGAGPVLYLAYAYAIGFELPAPRVEALMLDHERRCVEAGPRLCQLVGSNLSGDPDSSVQGYISLRAEPNWLRSFMAAMEAQAGQAGGRIVSQSTNTEDLTRAIVDTQARLNALTALRDRLQDLLRNRPGRLADLLEVERELARVQGEIDAIQSNLAVMRTRVAMSELTLHYQSAPRPLGSDTFRPLRDALAGFLRIMVTVFAWMVTAVAMLIPFAIVGGPLAWLALAWRRRRGGFLLPRRPVPPAPPPAAN